MSGRTQRHLTREFQAYERDPVPGVSIGLKADNLYVWTVLMQGPPDTLFEGGLFRAELRFPDNYPDQPPKFIFLTDIYHPNVYSDGNVCISILHPPGPDPLQYESAAERWLPVHTVSSIIVSIISLLSDPNCKSPANVDAAKLFKDDYPAYKKRVLACVRRSMED